MSIQSRLIMLLLIVLIPILGIQALIYYDRFQARKAEELEANVEVARAAGRAFEAFVQDVLHQELAIGIAATASPPLSPGDLTRLLQESARDVPAVLDYFWLSPQGSVLARSSSEAAGIEGSEMSWFNEIGAGREWVVSDLLLSKPTGSPRPTSVLTARALSENRWRISAPPLWSASVR